MRVYEPTLTRLIDAPAETLYRLWTGPYLDVVPDRGLVFCDAFTGAWMPRDAATGQLETLAKTTLRRTS